MKKLDEKLSLLRLAEAFGVAPDPKLLEEIKTLQDQQERLKARVHAASQALFEAPAKEYKRPSTYPDGKAIPAQLPDLYQPADNPGVPKNQRCDNCEYYVAESKKCTRWNNAVVKPAYWCAKWDPIVAKKAVKEETVPAQPESAVDIVSKYIKESTVVAPEPVLAQPVSGLENKVKQLEAWISRIAATGPGGGAGDVLNLSFFAKTVTSNYTIGRKDYYVGVNATTSVTITLPASAKSGQSIIVKDESGHCSINPITLTGTIDNDTSGAILAIDNGGLHLIYNTGWRII